MTAACRQPTLDASVQVNTVFPISAPHTSQAVRQLVASWLLPRTTVLAEKEFPLDQSKGKRQLGLYTRATLAL